MSNVTNLLERLGSDARLRYANGQELESSLQAFGLSAVERSAIVAGDHKQLEQLLGVSIKTVCLIEPVEDAVE